MYSTKPANGDAKQQKTFALNELSKKPTKALLIGLNYVEWESHQLQGCWQDVEDARALLLAMGVPKKDIIIITDDPDADLNRSTDRQAILNAFEEVVHNLKDGDVAFIHYSGHGIELKAPEGSGLSSIKAICPVDLFKGDSPDRTFQNAITSEDLKTIFGKVPEKANVTAVFDCCHSTGAFRALQAQDPNAKDRNAKDPKITVVRGLTFDSTTPELAHIATQAYASIKKDQEVTRDLFAHEYSPDELNPKNVVFFAAAQGWQTAADTTVGPKKCGAFSHYFYIALQQKVNEYLNVDLVHAVALELQESRYEQIPSLCCQPDRQHLPIFADFTKAVAKASVETRGLDFRPPPFEAKRLDPPPAAVSRDTPAPPPPTPVTPPPAPPGSLSMTNVAIEIANRMVASPALEQMRERNRGLFDFLVGKALPAVIPVVQAALGQLADAHRDLASPSNRVVAEMHLRQVLPVTLNVAAQLVNCPEVTGQVPADERGFSDLLKKVVPMVLSTAQQLLSSSLYDGTSSDTPNDGVPRGGTVTRGWFDSIVATVIPRALEAANRMSPELGGTRGTEVDPYLVPIAFNAAGAVVRTNISRGAGLSKIANNAKSKIPKVHPIIKDTVVGGTAYVLGNAFYGAGDAAYNVAYDATTKYGNKAFGLPNKNSESSENLQSPENRGFFGELIQNLTPIAIDVLKNVVSTQSREVKWAEEAETEEKKRHEELRHESVERERRQKSEEKKSSNGGAEEAETEEEEKKRHDVRVPVAVRVRRDAEDVKLPQRGIFDIVSAALPMVLNVVQEVIKRSRSVDIDTTSNQADAARVQSIVSAVLPELTDEALVMLNYNPRGLDEERGIIDLVSKVLPIALSLF